MLNAAQCSSMKALNAHVVLTESSVCRFKSLKSPPGCFLVDPVHYTTTDMPHGTSHFTVVTRFVLFCGDRVEVDVRRGVSSDGHLMHSALNAPSWLGIELHSALNAFWCLSIQH